MPPRGYHKESASETESKGAATSRAANKARHAVAAAAQLELLSKHIHSNGKRDLPPLDPLDFSSLPERALANYNRKYALNLPAAQGVSDNILRSEIGKKTHSARRSAGQHKITKPELAGHVQKHFLQMPVKENEVISSFLYKVKNQDKAFKLLF